MCMSLSTLDRSAARVCSVSPAWRGGETRGAPAVGQAQGARPLCPAAVRLRSGCVPAARLLASQERTEWAVRTLVFGHMGVFVSRFPSRLIYQFRN